MESRKPFLLNGALFYWNLFLAIFSFMGLVRMTPEMFWSVNSNSFKYSICTASYAQGGNYKISYFFKYIKYFQ